MNGLLVIDKPANWTSHDVVARVRRIAAERSIGHLGTLDPLATGVLPLVLGKWTRLAQFYLDAEKTYEGTLRFGVATDTYDAEGGQVGTPQAVNFSPEELKAALEGFRGAIRQTPPPFSAKKVNGVPAYKLARKKEDVVLEAVEVTVHEFEVTALDSAKASPPPAGEAGVESGVYAFRARVSSGTYVRSLAHDLGKKLGTGAHLASLRRTRHAEFDIAQAVTLEKLEQLASTDDIFQALLPARQVLPKLPTIIANDDQLAKIRHGNSVNLPELSAAPLIKVWTPDGELATIAKRIAGTLFQPKIVMLD